MKERNKPTKSWIEKSKNEIENEEKLLAKRMELLNDVRIKKLLFQDSEAFKVGYETGFSDACQITHDFAEMVYKMMEAQHDESIFNARLTCKRNSGIKIKEEEYLKHNEMILQMYEYESKVRNWIRENYPHLMED